MRSLRFFRHLSFFSLLFLFPTGNASAESSSTTDDPLASFEDPAELTRFQTRYLKTKDLELNQGQKAELLTLLKDRFSIGEIKRKFDESEEIEEILEEAQNQRDLTDVMWPTAVAIAGAGMAWIATESVLHACFKKEESTNPWPLITSGSGFLLFVFSFTPEELADVAEDKLEDELRAKWSHTSFDGINSFAEEHGLESNTEKYALFSQVSNALFETLIEERKSSSSEEELWEKIATKF